MSDTLTAYLARPVEQPPAGRAGGARAGPDRSARRAPAPRPGPAARSQRRSRSRTAGARCPTASATWPCAPRCRESAARWWTGGSTGIPAMRCATASGIRSPIRTTRWSCRAGGGPRPTGAPCTIPSRTWAPERCTHGSRSTRRREMGMSTDALDDPHVATIVCGYAGDDRRRVRHSPMFHVFLRDGDGVVLRSRFWLGAALRPYLPARSAAPGALRAQQPRSCAASRSRRACPARWPATAPRSTRTSARCCPSSMLASRRPVAST